MLPTSTNSYLRQTLVYVTNWELWAFIGQVGSNRELLLNYSSGGSSAWHLAGNIHSNWTSSWWDQCNLTTTRPHTRTHTAWETQRMAQRGEERGTRRRSHAEGGKDGGTLSYHRLTLWRRYGRHRWGLTRRPSPQAGSPPLLSSCPNISLPSSWRRVKDHGLQYRSSL